MTITLHAPQIIYLCLLLLGLVVAVAKHGEDKGKYHAGWTLVGEAILLWILYWGGFFG